MSQSNKPTQTQMNAAMSGSKRPSAASAPHGFGRIGIPAVAAAAEMLKTKKPVEKPVSTSFYLGSD